MNPMRRLGRRFPEPFAPESAHADSVVAGRLVGLAGNLRQPGSADVADTGAGGGRGHSRARRPGSSRRSRTHRPRHYPSDTSDTEWATIAPHVPAGTGRGRPLIYPSNAPSPGSTDAGEPSATTNADPGTTPQGQMGHDHHHGPLPRPTPAAHLKPLICQGRTKATTPPTPPPDSGSSANEPRAGNMKSCPRRNSSSAARLPAWRRR